MIIGLISLAKAVGGKLIVSFVGSRFFAKSRGVDDGICLRKSHSMDRPRLGRDVLRIDLHGIGAENGSDLDSADRDASALDFAGSASSQAIHRRTLLANLIDALSKMPAS